MNLTPRMIQDQRALEKLEKFLHANKLPYQDLPARSIASTSNVIIGYYDEAGNLLASGALEYYDDAALLRSVAVDESVRGQSIGKRIVDDMITRARAASVTSIYLLTETARDFFLHRGFQPIDRSIVPERLKSSTEFSYVCPQSAVCMFYKLER